MSNSSSSSSGIGFTGLLTVVFITLKLLDKIDWSWWLVLSPIWISIAIVIAILLGFGAFVVISAIISVRKRRKK